MRIYIKNIPNIDLKNLQKYLQNEHRYTQLYSDTGIYRVETNTIYLCEDVSCHNTENIQYPNLSLSLLLDKSVYSPKQKIVSQLPVNYIHFDMTTFEYGVSKKSPLKLMVEKSKCNMIPMQIYFVTNDSLDDYFIKQDFEELLMCFYS